MARGLSGSDQRNKKEKNGRDECNCKPRQTTQVLEGAGGNRKPHLGLETGALGLSSLCEVCKLLAT